ncbi:MAG TPA: quinoprotein dehydrogenase-associated putative ABC transporter substrate-binding protein [Terriglobales bacterium]|jgi:mxaJ protein|nr:quinoprotein dehydrogenase-associated putative ABC transporter substrate-binding protein [Terriglobales bacterium]
MYLRFLSAVLMLVLAPAAECRAQPRLLRFCADPDNLPFSNQAGQGLDNRIARMVARDIGREAQFVWTRNRRGFLREKFNNGVCDVLAGVPQGMRGVATSVPYYRSTYVFVTPARAHVSITRFDDPHLNGGQIGLQVLEENYAPPSLPLIRNGHARQLVGFEAFGERSQDIVKAVADGRVAVAVVWGPLAGYFARHDHLPVTLSLVSPTADQSGVPFSYAITLAVHPNDTVLLEEIDGALARLRPEIDALLTRYNVPRVADGKETR